ncbi:MAG: hypothetical protein WEB02_02590 [Methylophaga sp.]
MLETTELLGQIVRLCAEQKSGTLFLTTNINKACHIVFDEGQITAMAYGSVRGVAVTDLLLRLPVVACQFNSALRMPLSSRAMLANDNIVFDKLGLRRGAMQPVAATSSQRMYRGHPVSVTATAEVTADNNAFKANKSSKAKRIYRGQVIED